jgi:hypothetical protein
VLFVAREEAVESTAGYGSENREVRLAKYSIPLMTAGHGLHVFYRHGRSSKTSTKFTEGEYLKRIKQLF